ncbi:MAG: hypothetical protein Q9218_006162 [Villophora microphyllina]
MSSQLDPLLDQMYRMQRDQCMMDSIRGVRDRINSESKIQEAEFKEVKSDCAKIERYVDVASIRVLGVESVVKQNRTNIAQGFDDLEGNVAESEKNANCRFDILDNSTQETQRLMRNDKEEVIRKVNGCIDSIETRIDRRFVKLENLARNRMCTHVWERIRAVHTWDAEGRYILPTCFPLTVKDFWALKDDDRCKSSASTYAETTRLMLAIVWDLAHLLRIYKVSEHGWDDDVDDTTKDRYERVLAKSKWTALEKAILVCKEKAHRALSMELGLDYDKIQNAFNDNEPPSQRNEDGDGCQDSVEDMLAEAKVLQTRVNNKLAQVAEVRERAQAIARKGFETVGKNVRPPQSAIEVQEPAKKQPQKRKREEQPSTTRRTRAKA